MLLTVEGLFAVIGSSRSGHISGRVMILCLDEGQFQIKHSHTHADRLTIRICLLEPNMPTMPHGCGVRRVLTENNVPCFTIYSKMIHCACV